MCVTIEVYKPFIRDNNWQSHKINGYELQYTYSPVIIYNFQLITNNITYILCLKCEKFLLAVAK
jgi:hypothetical protein